MTTLSPKNFIKVMLAALLLQAATTASAVNPSFFKRVNQAQMNEWVESQITALSPRDRVAQLFFIAVTANDTPENRKRVDHLVGECHVGGMIYDHGTIMGQAALNNYAQSISNVPLLITYDGEWGLSMRLSDAPKFPRNMVLGAANNDKLMYEYGKEVARQMRRIGVHVNFAPVLDINDNPLNAVIGARSLGESPERVASLGIAYAKGLEDGGVVSVAKHFPGHGSTTEDSHKTLPKNEKTMRELKLCELVPFTQYINAGLSGIMVGHINIPAIDPSGTPTSLSKDCVDGLLHDKLGFTGLSFTDALEMKGAGSGNNAVDALIAGNDVLLMPKNVDKQIDAIMDAIASGKISQDYVDQRCRKILRYKYAAGLATNPVEINTDNLVEDINLPSAGSLINRLWASAITVVKNKSSLLPLKHLEEKNIALITLGNTSNEPTMMMRRSAMYAPVTPFSAKPGDNIDALKKRLNEENFNTVIIALHSAESQFATLASNLAAGLKNVVVVVFADAYKTASCAAAIKNAKAAVLAYNDCNEAQDFAAQTIFGGNAARGVTPVSIQGVCKAGTGFKYDANRLGYGLPDEVGFNSKLSAVIDSLVMLGIDERAFSGCQVLVARHGKVVINKAVGVTDIKSKTPVDVNTLFDLASVSKATGTISAVMKAYDRGYFRLDDRASKYIPGLRGSNKEDVTFRQLLFHETGIQPSLNLFEIMYSTSKHQGKLLTTRRTSRNSIKIYNKLYGNKWARMRTDIVSKTPTDRFNIKIAEGLYGGKETYDTVMARIYNSPLRPTKALCYSCLNFSLLADATQRMNGKWQNDFLDHYFWKPLGAEHIAYRPTEKFSKAHIAATEYDSFMRRQMVHGYVHDELAAISGGVQGNAGLFGSANDLAKLFQMWLNGGVYGGIQFLKPETVKTFTTTKSPNSHRGLGFDKPNVARPENSTCCEEATPETFGHTGFTGTCYWIDPTNDMIYIFLSNRVHTTRDNANWNRLGIRYQIHSAIYNAITR